MNRASRDSLSEAQLHIVQEAGRIERAARREERKERKANKKARSTAQNLEVARSALDGVQARFRQPREHDDAFMAWLRDIGLCIACLIEGRPAHPGPIEAAHQKQNIAAAGWTKVSGRRAHDRQCVGLCRFHHQDAPNACDKGQRQFWDRLGIGDRIADLCAELYAAFKGGSDGALIIRRYATEAKTRPAIIEDTV
jgi:hypothetical protein